MTFSKRAAATLAMLALVAGAGLLSAPAAHAAAGVTVANAEGAATADPDYATEVTVTGSGFQSIPKGFGGVYVLFGWVDDASGGSWRPSRGGAVGTQYRYVPDSETQDNKGFMRFVAFPGSETEGAAHAIMAADGSWTVSMVIPGASFESHDRDGNTSSIDCRQVTCGIITIGAHGVKNANNETFTPIRFAAAGAAAAPGTATTAPAAAGEVRVGLQSSKVRAGTSIVFTGQGFQPGEQVVAALDDGVTAIGPLTAGTRGDVAGALPVPRDSRAGTHLVSLRAAATGTTAQAEVTVEADAAAAGALSASDADQQVPQWAVLVLLGTIVIALVLVIVSVIASLRRAASRRRARREAGAESPAASSPPETSAPPTRAEDPMSWLPDGRVAAARRRGVDGAADDTAPTEVLTAGEGR